MVEAVSQIETLDVVTIHIHLCVWTTWSERAHEVKRVWHTWAMVVLKRWMTGWLQFMSGFLASWMTSHVHDRTAAVILSLVLCTFVTVYFSAGEALPTAQKDTKTITTSTDADVQAVQEDTDEGRNWCDGEDVVPGSPMVYFTMNGKAYHSQLTCGGLRFAQGLPMQRLACKKCCKNIQAGRGKRGASELTGTETPLAA